MPLLTTKFYIPPPRSELVPRPRLIQQLDKGLHRKLTLISAPAGFGKSSLLSAWLQQLARDDRVAWLSLDAGDSDLACFMTYFIAALQTVESDFGQSALSALESPEVDITPGVLISLLNEIMEFSDQVVVILDDYHLIESSPVDQALTFLLDHIPSQLHLVIATREDPQLPLAQLRARGQMTELRVADLRFNRSEATGFLTQVMGLNLSAEDIAALETRTEGWIAGLQLAALALQSQNDTAGFIKSFTGSHHFVMDYLVAEAMAQQPEGVQTFLMRTSILDHLCGPLCDAILQDPSASGQETLEYLERANLFIVPLDNQRQWYRYHHLFADVIRARLLKEQPDQVFLLHHRASVWYEQNGMLSDAVNHALAAEDYERTAGLMEMAWPAMEGVLEWTMWLGWGKTLPDNMVRNRPVLSVGYAWAFLNTGELEAAEVRLQDAEQWLELTTVISERLETPSAETCPAMSPKGERSRRMVVVDEAHFQSLPASIATARAYLAQALGDATDTVKYARQVLALLPEEDHIRRGQATTLMGLAYWANGDLEAAHRSFLDFMELMQMADDISGAINATFVQADISLALGRLNDAFSLYQQALQFVEEQCTPVPIGTEDLHRGISEVFREQGDLEAAVQHLLKSQKLGEQTPLPDWQHRLYVTQARVQETKGDLAGALNLLDAAERLRIRTPLPEVHPIAALKARILVKQGRLTKALDWARQRGLSIDDELSYLREFEHLTLVRVLIAQYQRDRGDNAIHRAVGLLERLLQAAEAGGWQGSVIEILVLQALAYEAQGDVSAALRPLERALTLAAPEGYFRIFVDEGQPMAHLLSETVAQGIMPDYTGKLLTEIHAEMQRSENKSHPSTAQSLIEPLSERELEVLRLVAQGLSNRQVSVRLFLAENTVKGYNRRIFRKLGVKTRTEAAAHARELGLL